MRLCDVYSDPVDRAIELLASREAEDELEDQREI
jgi:hypothetical protein